MITDGVDRLREGAKVEVTQPGGGAPRGDGKGGPRGDGKARLEGMDPAKREEFMKRFQNMTPEQKEEFRKRREAREGAAGKPSQ